MLTKSRAAHLAVAAVPGLLAALLAGSRVGAGAHPPAPCEEAPRAAAPTAGRALSPSQASFEKTIRPLLADRCAPCHAPGGTMYEKLPFDDAEVVASHVPGMKKRLKGDDLKALEAWLAERSAADGVRKAGRS